MESLLEWVLLGGIVVFALVFMAPDYGEGMKDLDRDS